MEEELERFKIGEVGVDSGQLIVMDPCYLQGWNHGDFTDDATNDYANACKVTLKKPNHAGMTFGDLAAVFSSGYGDGTYEVIGYKNSDGRIVKVEILMGE